MPEIVFEYFGGKWAWVVRVNGVILVDDDGIENYITQLRKAGAAAKTMNE